FLQKLWQVMGPHIAIVDVTEQRLEGTRRARRLLHGIEIKRHACLQDIAQVLGGNAHGVKFVATLLRRDRARAALEGFEPGAHGFPDPTIHVWPWDVSPRRLTDVHQVHERLLPLLNQLTRGEPLDCLPYWLVQGVTPLLQAQVEAFEAR